MNGRVAAEPAGQVAGGGTLPTTFRVSEPGSGEEADGDSTIPAISANGRFVAFASQATNLDPLFDDNGFQDIFLKDLATDVITRVVGFSQTGTPNGDSKNPDVSADGRYVVFETLADDLTNGEPGDFNESSDVFLYERDNTSSQLTLISMSNYEFSIGNGPSYLPSISANGRRIAFVSEASNLTRDDTDVIADIFVFDDATFELLLVYVSSNGT